MTKLPEEGLRKIGLTPDTWKLEVLAEGGSVIERPFTLDWPALMRLAGRHAIRFLQVINCTNGPDPFHMSHWEGVPLREIVWMAGPKESIRRVYYDSYVPPGRPTFRSSLPLGMVLETPPGEIPPVLAYKMNGELIPASLGGPVRMIVPGSYGSRHIKWLTRIVLTNEFKANDSDADLNNDPDNAQKTRARFLNPPPEVPANQPFALTGYAQIGISGLSKVQYRVGPDWKDAEILPPPKLPPNTLGTDHWPIRYTIAHWAALVPGLPPGSYELACRTIDGNGIAQPLPRPLLRTGFNTIHTVPLLVR